MSPIDDDDIERIRDTFEEVSARHDVEKKKPPVAWIAIVSLAVTCCVAGAGYLVGYGGLNAMTTSNTRAIEMLEEKKADKEKLIDSMLLVREALEDNKRQHEKILSQLAEIVKEMRR